MAIIEITQEQANQVQQTIQHRTKVNTRMLQSLVDNHIAAHREFWKNPIEMCATYGTESVALFEIGSATLEYISLILSKAYGRSIATTDIEFLKLFNPEVTIHDCGLNFNPEAWIMYFIPALAYTFNGDGTVTIG